MSGVEAVVAVLLADATVTALVAPANIAPGVLPQGTPLPAISVSSISAVDFNIASPGQHRFVTERVQVTVLASTYPEQKQVLAAVKQAAADRLDVVVAGLSGVSIHTDGAGPDFMDANASIYIGSQDFRVKFSELR